jgi:hypothetical protein
MPIISSSIELITALKDAITQLDSHDIWWRGHAESSWELRPKIYRREDAGIIENDLVRSFRRKAQARHRNCPLQEDISNWLFLMQHHGLPTRLLDWTESILIGTFFAVEDKEKHSKDGALWALSPVGINEHQFGKRIFLSGTSPEVRPLFVHAFDHKAAKMEKIAAITATEIDVRIMVQLGAFTIHGVEERLEEISGNEKYLLKFEIPAEAKKQLFNFIFDLGIRKSNLFPDLDSLANELAYFDYKEL